MINISGFDNKFYYTNIYKGKDNSDETESCDFDSTDNDSKNCEFYDNKKLNFNKRLWSPAECFAFREAAKALMRLAEKNKNPIKSGDDLKNRLFKILKCNSSHKCLNNCVGYFSQIFKLKENK